MAYLQVNGTAVLTANTQEHHRTALSERFLGTLARTHPTRPLITTFVPGFQLPSVYLEYDVVADAQYDIIAPRLSTQLSRVQRRPIRALQVCILDPGSASTTTLLVMLLEIGRLASQVTLDHLPQYHSSLLTLKL
ncbi:hypothetical protein B0H16DRAFT_1896715 [Mycena metata]|uniref:Uncharacterized protein n=1 Tax=Mycena metata TaxID=1033252 RepID=A0AAD7MJZ5_9AGAR|nr:hypothetical protein B0H16DRAFT_1896715 [Mycena metata]